VQMMLGHVGRQSHDIQELDFVLHLYGLTVVSN